MQRMLSNQRACIRILFFTILRAKRAFYSSSATALLSSNSEGQGSNLPAPGGASNSGNTPVSDDWNSFDERVLLEPMPNSSSSSVNGPANAEPADSSQTSGDQNRDPEELLQKKEELIYERVREQLRHYFERGRPQWRIDHSEEKKKLYSEITNLIISSLEIKETVSDHDNLFSALRSKDS